MSIAFFDIDGTLLLRPSLERRLFRALRWQGKIPVANYFAWIAETIRLGLRSLRAAAQANKTYLRGVSAEVLSLNAANQRTVFPGKGFPELFPAAVQCVWWHALRGDSIVLVSGTLAPLAEIVKFALERELLRRGVETRVAVIATQVEICNGKLTGRVAGPAMFGEMKVQAIREFSRAANISLEYCYAYGDSSLDRWMLAAVGHPHAVNPTARMQRIARSHGWKMLAWRLQSRGELRSEQRQWKKASKSAL
jgi:HAD superfamily hydrolase (TIGR01490 family)